MPKNQPTKSTRKATSKTAAKPEPQKRKKPPSPRKPNSTRKTKLPKPSRPLPQPLPLTPGWTPVNAILQFPLFLEEFIRASAKGFYSDTTPMRLKTVLLLALIAATFVLATFEFTKIILRHETVVLLIDKGYAIINKTFFS